MAKATTVFVCSACGHESAKWVGKCPACNEWNTMDEERIQKSQPTRGLSQGSKPQQIDDIPWQDMARLSTGFIELDRVLGGGIVPGSLILLGGDPGIGKSTLLLQIAQPLAMNEPLLYISGEESPRQIKMRANRLKVSAKGLLILSETTIENVESAILDVKPQVVVVDSIQTMYCPEMTSAPGSVSQVRESAARLLRVAKTTGCAIFLVGHVTKEGAIAGPRVLEHMVDTVLYFEGDYHHEYRILRAVKNRFGSTNEIGLFKMSEGGMVEVTNVSEALLSKRAQMVPGSAVICTIEGSRPILVEVQALLCTTAFGMPRRMANGLDYNRMVLLLAVMEKRAGLPLYNQDAYLNVAGGLKLDEPAGDLGVVAAVASSFRNQPILTNVAVMGEVGLTGEVRAVSHIEKRLSECHKLGFQTCLVPNDNLKDLRIPDGLKVIGVSNVSDALKALLDW